MAYDIEGPAALGRRCWRNIFGMSYHPGRRYYTKTISLRYVVPPCAVRHRHAKLISQPIEQVPYSPDYPDLQDWDDPPTCILWSDFRDTLRTIQSTGTLPAQHQSHDHLNKQVEVDVDAGVLDTAREAFQRIEQQYRETGYELVWFIVDGFVLYWDKVCLTDYLGGAGHKTVADDTGSCRYAGYQVVPTGPEFITQEKEGRTPDIRTAE